MTTEEHEAEIALREMRRKSRKRDLRIVNLENAVYWAGELRRNEKLGLPKDSATIRMLRGKLDDAIVAVEEGPRPEECK